MAVPTPDQPGGRLVFRRALTTKYSLVKVLFAVAASVAIAVVSWRSTQPPDAWPAIGLVYVGIVSALALSFFMDVSRQPTDVAAAAQSSIEEAAPSYGRKELERRYLHQCEAMIAHAIDRGKIVAPEDFAVVRRAGRVPPEDWEFYPILAGQLSVVHDNLCRMVAPALPKTVYQIFSGSTTSRWRPWLGSIRLVTKLLALATVLVTAFVALAVWKGDLVNSVLIKADPNIKRTPGDLIFVIGYLLVAAGMGAAFAMLTSTARNVSDATFDEEAEPYVWVQLVLGVVAGAVLAVGLSRTIVNLFDLAASSSDASSTDKQSNDFGILITPPLLALVGGFSSDLVYRILRRIIEGFETILSGSPARHIDMVREETEDRIRQQFIGDDLRDRLTIITHAEQLRTLLARGKPQPATGSTADGKGLTVDAVLDSLVETVGGPNQAPPTPDRASVAACLRPHISEGVALTDEQIDMVGDDLLVRGVTFKKNERTIALRSVLRLVRAKFNVVHEEVAGEMSKPSNSQEA